MDATDNRFYREAPAPTADPLHDLAPSIQEQIKESAWCWHTCSGCHESEDGHPIGHYPHSEAFGCVLGGGCSECGGIGAVWDTTDYADMADFIASPTPTAREARVTEIADDLMKLWFCGADTFRAELVKVLASITASPPGEGVVEALRHVTVYLIEGDDAVHLSICGEKIGAFGQHTKRAQALLQFEAQCRALRLTQGGDAGLSSEKRGRNTTAAADYLMRADDTELAMILRHDPSMIRDVAAALIFERHPADLHRPHPTPGSESIGDNQRLVADGVGAISNAEQGARKFRKKPVVIEAVQWRGDMKPFQPWLDELGGLPFSVVDPYSPECSIKIETLEGTMKAGPKDWIIRGVKGEFYPCKPDIFAATYEPAPTTDARNTSGESPSNAEVVVPASPSPNPNSEWQDISTAPNDGTPVDLWVRHIDGHERREANMVLVDKQVWKRALGPVLMSNLEAVNTPTHWRPLPAPPRLQPLSGKERT